MFDKLWIRLYYNIYKLIYTYSADIEKSEFELLLMALGYNLTPSDIDGCISEIFTGSSMHCTSGNKITFPAFCHWWMETDSAHLHSRK